MTLRQERVALQIQGLAAQFLERESDRTTMITVTRVALSKDFKNATVFFTVFPEDKEGVALDFTKRQRKNLRNYVKKGSVLKRLPFFDFEIDYGEKNRQRIDELSNSN